MITTPPNGLDEIIAVYGSIDDPNFEQNNIVEFALPYSLKYNGVLVTHARCHKLTVDNFIAAFNNVAAAGAADMFAQEYNGTFEQRPIRGFPSHPSAHSWGIALDMGASTHPLGSMATWPQPILDAMKAAGFFWGGNFLSRKDPMHFQLATGY